MQAQDRTTVDNSSAREVSLRTCGCHLHMLLWVAVVGRELGTVTHVEVWE